MAETLPVVGNCEKCGRKFVTLPPDGIDHYYPANTRQRSQTDEECGGRVVKIEKRD